MKEDCTIYDGSTTRAYSTIALLNILYSYVCADVHQHPVHDGMLKRQVSVPRIHLQDIGVENPCLARQVKFSVSGSIEAIDQYNHSSL
jgi:hypothetical protein